MIAHSALGADPHGAPRHGRVRGERTVRSTSHEQIVGLITGEFGDQTAPPAGRAS